MSRICSSVRSAFLITTAAGALLGAPSAVAAQEAPTTPETDAAADASDDQGLDVIVVQARKVSENLQDVPVAVTAFSGSDLEKQNFQQLDNLASYTPGLRMAGGAASPSAAVITLRGQVQTDILASLDPSVGTYVDGVYWARSYGLNSNLLDVESVQVLKGPQGTLFGRNTTGGAILINSKNPDMDELQGSLGLSYGRFNEFEATGMINLPIVTDKIALRIAASRTSRDGYTTNIAPASATTKLGGAAFLDPAARTGSLTGDKYDGRDRWNVRAKLAIRPTDTLELLFSAERYDADDSAAPRYLSYVPTKFSGAPGRTNYDVGNNASILVGILNGNSAATAAAPGAAILNSIVAALAADPRVASMNEAPRNIVKTSTLGFTGSLDVPWGQAKLITAYRKVDAQGILDVDGSPYPLYATGNVQNLRQYSGELQTTGKAFDNSLEFAVGLFYFHEYGSDDYTGRILSGLLPVYQNSWGYITNDSMGIYGQATLHITDQLGLTGGLRYSVDDKALESRNADYVIASGTMSCKLVPVAYVAPEDSAPERCAVSTKDSFSGVSYTLGLDYKLTDNTMIYVKTAKGFRAGGFNFRARNRIDFVSFKPEIAKSYEAGLKTELLDRRLRINLAAYITDVDDIQRTAIIAVPPVPPATVGSASTILGNAGTARFKGFEAEVALRPVSGLTLTGNVGHTDPSYVKFADASGDRRHERFAQVTRWQYSFGADYDASLGGDLDLNLHADYSWRGKTPSAEYNYEANPKNAEIIAATTLPAIGLVGARATLTYGNYELALWGRNLTNERGYVGSLAVFPLGFVGAWRQEPATYGLAAKVRF